MGDIANKIIESSGLKPATPAPAAGGDDIKPPTTPAPAAGGDDIKPPATPAPAAKITDESVIEYLRGQGVNISKIDELKKPMTDDEKKKNEADRKKNILLFGISNNIIKGEEEYRQHLSDLNKPAREIAFELYRQEILEENPQATIEEINEGFESEYFEDLPETDKRRVRAKKRMNDIKGDYIYDKYGHILELESQYDAYESASKARENYITEVDEIISSMPRELSFEIKDRVDSKKTYSYKYILSDGEVSEINNLYKGPEHVALFSTGKVTKENMAAAITNTILNKNLHKIINEVATAHASSLLLEAPRGRRGILPERNEGGSGELEEDKYVGKGIAIGIVETEKNKY